MRTIYKIFPSGKLINKLPETVNLALKSEDHILYAFTVAQDESQYIYTSFNQLEISLHADSFQWSQFVPCAVVESIGLIDFNDNKLNVKINMFVDEDNISNVILYPIAVLYNDSDFNLFVRDPESKGHNHKTIFPKKAMSLSNNRVLVLKPELPLTSGFTSKHTSYTKVYMSQDEITCKF